MVSKERHRRFHATPEQCFGRQGGSKACPSRCSECAVASVWLPIAPALLLHVIIWWRFGGVRRSFFAPAPARLLLDAATRALHQQPGWAVLRSSLYYHGRSMYCARAQLSLHTLHLVVNDAAAPLGCPASRCEPVRVVITHETGTHFLPYIALARSWLCGPVPVRMSCISL